jgi:uncharacterized protein (TIGR02217 family)
VTAFHEVTFPVSLGFGASGGPARRTEIVTLGSGREERNTPWAHARRRYDVGSAVRTLDDLHAVIDFFEARRGGLYGFRFRDFADWRSCAPSQTPTMLDQPLGAGDGETAAFQLSKTYGAAGFAYVRPIRKPIAGSVLVAIDAAAIAAPDYAVDTATGVVTFAVPPAAGAAITAGFTFDTPVRFDADQLDLSLDAFGAGRLISIPLIEIIV